MAPWKESTCRCRRLRFDPWAGKIPWRRKWQPTPVFLPGKSHGQRILVGYSPWGRKELDATEQQITRMHTLDAKREGFEESLVAKGLHWLALQSFL